MNDLTSAQWRDVELASVYIPDGRRAIPLGELRNIIRRSRRTNDQNSLLWALYQDALDRAGETLGGWTKEDIHEYMLGEFFGWDKREAFGRTRLKPKKRSSRLTKTQFSEFVEFIVATFAQHGIVLELPGDLP